MKLKKKRKWVWCTEKPLHCPELNVFGDRIRDKVKTYSCTIKKLPAKIKCPLCKKKFKPRIRECGDANCWHVWIPPHKKLE